MSGTTVDANIALNANAPKPINPLVQAGQFATTMGNLTSLQQARINIAKQNALAQAYQGATIDSRTGLPDVPSIMATLQSRPYGGLAIPDAIQANQAMRLNAIKNAQASSQVATSALGALARLGPNVSNDQVYGVLKALNTAGYPGIDRMVQQAQDGMPVDPTGSDPQHGQKLHDWLMNTYLRDVGPGVETPAVTPDLQPYNNGPSIGLMNRSTTAGTPGATYGAPVPTAMTPAEKAHPVTGPVNAQGQPTTVPLGTYATQHGLGPDGNPLPSTLGTGNYPTVPPALRNPAPSPAAGAPASGASTAPSPNTATPTGVGPGQQVYMHGRGAESADEMNGLNRAALDVPQQMSQLTAMLGDLQKFKSGQNTTLWGSIKNRFVQMGLAPESWSDSLSAQENFSKMANQFLAKQASAMGAMTNDKLALSAESGPNPLFSNLGNEGVLHIAQGNMDALNVKNQAALAAEKAATASGGAFNYPQWSAQFNQTFTPSAFWYARMSQRERQTFLGGLKTLQDKAQFQAELVNAIHQHWIDPAALGFPAPSGPPAVIDVNHG